MRILNLALCLLASLVAGTAHAEPQWLTLPPTPTLPKAEESGLAPVNGIKIWYATFGQSGGEPVVLLHGGLANSNYWGHQVPVLAERYRVIVMDSRGHGRSTRDERPYGYALMASEAGMIGITGTNARPSVAPTFGTENMLGTNALTFGMPTDEKFPFLLDCATSTTQRGKIEVYAKLGKKMPKGWVINDAGEARTDSRAVLNELDQGKEPE